MIADADAAGDQRDARRHARGSQPIAGSNSTSAFTSAVRLRRVDAQRTWRRHTSDQRRRPSGRRGMTLASHVVAPDAVAHRAHHGIIVGDAVEKALVTADALAGRPA